MERARATWTDERLDDLARGVESGFGRVDDELRSVRAEMTALRAEMNARFDALQRLLIQIGGGMIVTFVVGFAGLIATQI